MESELDRRNLWDAYIHALCEICNAEIHVNYLNQLHFVRVHDIRVLLCATEAQKQQAFAAVSDKG